MAISPEFRKKLNEAKAEDTRAMMHEAIAKLGKEAEEMEEAEVEIEETEEPELNELEESRKAELHDAKMSLLKKMEETLQLEGALKELEPIWSEYMKAIQLLLKGIADTFTISGKAEVKNDGLLYTRVFKFFKDGKEVNPEQFNQILKPEGN